MDTIIRAAIVYIAILVIFRMAGQRSVANITTFDLVLTLIISEAIQEGLIDQDHSFTNAMLLVVTLIGLDIALSLIKQRSQRIQKILEGTPLVIIEEGRVRRDYLDKERVDLGDILEAARDRLSMLSLEEIRYAILEKNGTITIIPKERQKD